MLPSRFQRKCSTSTTHLQTIQKSIALPWVRFHHILILLFWQSLTHLTFPVLHPCHKLWYFKVASWDEEWVNTAKDLVHKQFELQYSLQTVEQVMTQAPGGTQTEGSQSMVHHKDTYVHCTLLNVQNSPNVQKTFLMISQFWPLFMAPLFLMN